MLVTTSDLHDTTVSWPIRLRRAWSSHPRLAMGVRSAIAAALAWAVAQILPGPGDEFPYYAPMGAVIATTFTVAGSVRESIQTVGAIALGGTIAILIDLVAPESSPLTVGVVVALGVLAGGWRRLGGAGTWVPISALFTLVIGQGDAFYVGAYAGLVFLGAAIGILINLAFPPLPLAPLRHTLSRVRRTVRDQLGDLAEMLEKDEPLDPQEWEKHERDLTPQRGELRAALTTARESRRGNVRARRYSQDFEALARDAQAVDRLAQHVAELSDLLATGEHSQVHEPSLGPSLRPHAGRVLRGMESLVGLADSGKAEERTDELQRVREALEELTAETDRARRAESPGGGVLAAAALVTATRRCLDELDILIEGTRAELSEEPPNPGPPAGEAHGHTDD